jgi:hypothetical protein
MMSRLLAFLLLSLTLGAGCATSGKRLHLTDNHHYFDDSGNRRADPFDEDDDSFFGSLFESFMDSLFD